MIDLTPTVEAWEAWLELRSNPHANRNFFGQLSPEIHIDYQGQPWSKGIPYVRPISSTFCVCQIIGYTQNDRCILAD